MKWTISTAIDSTIANSFLSRMHISMGKSIIIIEKERLIRERSSQEKDKLQRQSKKIIAGEVMHLSHIMRKPTFCICENKDTDQLSGDLLNR